MTGWAPMASAEGTVPDGGTAPFVDAAIFGILCAGLVVGLCVGFYLGWWLHGQVTK